MKKKKYGVSVGQIILIILVLIGLILVVRFFVDMLLDIKPQFTIYKEECRNEKNQTLLNEVMKLKAERDRQEEKYYQGQCDEDVKCFPHQQIGNIPEWKCYDFSKETCDDLKKEIDVLFKEYWRLRERWWVEEIKVCEKKEVEEIDGWFEDSCSGICDCYKSMSCELTDRFILIFQNDTNKNLLINWIENYTQKQVKYENNKLYFEKGSYNDVIKLSMINDICNLDTISIGELKCKGDIDKSHLTKDWLDRECNCLDICEDLKCSNRDKCQEYKCFKNYFVEKK